MTVSIAFLPAFDNDSIMIFFDTLEPLVFVTNNIEECCIGVSRVNFFQTFNQRIIARYVFDLLDVFISTTLVLYTNVSFQYVPAM